MTINLETLSLPELTSLRDQIAAELPRRVAQEKKNARAALELLAAERGFNLDELLGFNKVQNGRGSPRGPVAPKYRDPLQPNVVWSGRGRRPIWFVEALERGVPESALLIQG